MLWSDHARQVKSYTKYQDNVKQERLFLLFHTQWDCNQICYFSYFTTCLMTPGRKIQTTFKSKLMNIKKLKVEAAKAIWGGIYTTMALVIDLPPAVPWGFLSPLNALFDSAQWRNPQVCFLLCKAVAEQPWTGSSGEGFHGLPQAEWANTDPPLGAPPRGPDTTVTNPQHSELSHC